jgi:hypothetical protein
MAVNSPSPPAASTHSPPLPHSENSPMPLATREKTGEKTGKLGPSTCRFCRKCISVNALRTDVCFEGAWGPSMGLRRTGLGLRSLWRLCLRGTAKEFVRLRCVIRRRCGQACRGVRCGLRSTCGRGHIITSSQRGHQNPRNQHNFPDRHRAFEVLCPQICILIWVPVTRMVPGKGRRESSGSVMGCGGAADTDTGWGRFRGAESRRSASQANSRARWRARSVSPPSWLACIRHAMRLMSHARFPDRVSSPQTSANFARSSLTVIRCSAATSCVTFNAMFLLRFTGESGLSTVPTIEPGLRTNIKSSGREFRRDWRGQSFAFEQSANGGGKECGQFRSRGGIRAFGRNGLHSRSPWCVLLLDRCGLSGKDSPSVWRATRFELEMTKKGWRGRRVVNSGRRVGLRMGPCWVFQEAVPQDACLSNFSADAQRGLCSVRNY